MKRKEIAAVIEQVGIVPAIRVLSADEAHFAAEAVAGGGIPIVEITMTVPGAMDVIAHLVKHHPKLIVGAGTVLDVGNRPAVRGCRSALPDRSGIRLRHRDLRGRTRHGFHARRIDSNRGRYCVARGSRFRESFSCGSSGWRRVRARAHSFAAASFADRLGRS